MLDKQGFTLLELLLCLAVLSTASCIFLPFVKTQSFSSEMFVLDALELQSEAMKEMDGRSIYYDGFELTYNGTGNVSQAHTFVFDRNIVVAHLGWGRLVEK